MTEKEEAAYIEAANDGYTAGNRAAWRQLLADALKHLGHDHPGCAEAGLLLEREQAIVALRGACEKTGDNDWPDDLHLADIIEKHLTSRLD